MIGSWDLQRAVVTALKGAGVADGRIHDDETTDKIYPCVEVGETQTLNGDVQGRAGGEEALTLHIWDAPNATTAYRGQKTVKQIADQIHTVFNGKNVDVAGRDYALAIVRDFRTVKEPDGITQHGLLTLRVQHFGPRET